MAQTAKPDFSNSFIPCTMARSVGDGVFFRPIRSWHSNTYAGERLTQVHGDASGCMRKEEFNGIAVCNIPYTVTHRLYWHKSAPEKTISAFLSYPNGMGCADEYFWEAYGVEKDGYEKRYFGDGAEAKMETDIKVFFTTKAKAERR